MLKIISLIFYIHFNSYFYFIAICYAYYLNYLMSPLNSKNYPLIFIYYNSHHYFINYCYY